MESKEPRPNRVCFLSEDVETVAQVSERLAEEGVEVLAFPDVGALSAGMGPPAESILVLDTGVLPPEQDIPRFLHHIDGLMGGRPLLVCVAHAKDIELRLQALRAGAEAFFASPVAIDELSARLLALSGARGRPRYRVLVVDDQPVAAVFAARVLRKAGMEVHVVGDALQVLDTLEELRPDLVLMDLHMPGADGIEITTLIRQHDGLYDTPVIFLSSEMDSGRQMDALRVGGDDFLAKPVRPKQLVDTVQRRVRAYRSRKERHRAGYARDSKISRGEKSCTLARAEGGGGIGRCFPSIPAGFGSKNEAQLVAMVEDALRGGGLHLMHQPIMALRGLTGERYDTTLRLKSRDGEYVPAFEFLSAAKRGGLMPAIDRWVMEQALDELKQQRHDHPRLRFFVHQTMETLRAADWLPWLRDQISVRDLIKQRPILQIQHRDLTDHKELADARFPDLHRLGIKTCLNAAADVPGVSGLIEDLGISLVRLPLQTVASMEPEALADFVADLHTLGSQVIVARIEQPQAIARAWRCGVDFIQGNFLQLPSQDLSFDFNESTLT